MLSKVYLLVLVWLLVGKSPVTPSSTPSPSPSPSPSTKPLTCPSRVTLSQMCSSLNSFKNQTLSQATSGDCTISDDCLNVQCGFNVTYIGIPIPMDMNMTLLPCTSPYSFGLVVSSSFLGDLANGVYCENSAVLFTAFDLPGIVVITVVQQEFGVTISVAAVFVAETLIEIPLMDVYMHCADSCLSSSPTLPTSTAP